jgi:hypothetical protein
MEKFKVKFEWAFNGYNFERVMEVELESGDEDTLEEWYEDRDEEYMVMEDQFIVGKNKYKDQISGNYYIID